MLAIISHINTDFDSLASMVAVHKLYPDAIMVFTGSPENNVKIFLNDFPEFSPKKERNVNLNQINRLIIVDTARKSRIGNFYMLLNSITPELIIDHHDEESADISARNRIIRKSGANVTILIDMLRENNIEINEKEATLMALGIYEDTNFFTNIETTEKDFAAMSYLFSRGADIRLINQYLTREMTGDEFRLLTEMAENLEEINIKGISIWLTSLYLDTYFPDIASLIQRLKKIYNIDALFAYIVMDKKVLIIARSSLDIVRCNEILGYWGGGGHPTAASVTIDKIVGYDEVKQKITEFVFNRFKNLMTVEKLMSSPVETIREDVTIEIAKEKILQIHHNSLVVVDKYGNFRGIISRDNIYKALHHNLNKFYVYEIMDIDVITIEKDTPIELVKKMILDTQQRKFPVVENNKVIGIITANDIINTFLENKFNLNIESAENLKDLMYDFFPESEFEIIKKIGFLANNLGYRAYLVGGIVRDILLDRRKFDDIDIVIEGEIYPLLKEIKKKFGVHYVFHKRFNTSTVFFDNFSVDIASARKEFYIEPGALPRVEKSFLRYDLYRRDFSINAMAVSLNEYNFGILIDFFNGKKDLETKIIRVLHNLSFIEDPTRIIRAVRYEQRFNFKIGKHTLHLLKIALKNDIFKKISGQRLQDEFIILLKEESAVRCLKRLDELNILSSFPCKIILDKETLSILENIESFVKWYRFLLEESELNVVRIYLIGLLYNRSYQEIADFFKIFVFSKSVKEEIKKLKKISNDIGNKLNNKKIKKSELYFLLVQFDIEIIIFWLSLFTDLTIRENIMFYIKHLKDFKIKINGNDLIKLGLQPGEHFKKILYKVKEARLDGVITEDQELDFVKSLVKNNGIY